MPDPGNAPFHRPLADFRDRFGAVGVGAATITSSGDVVVDAIGSRRHGSPDRVTVDDQWHIGSCAKSITAALYGRLVECGAAEWGVPIAECFPDLAGDLAPEWAGPTVDEVLVCRSGMQADLPGSEMAQAWTDESPLVDQRSHATRFALSRPPRGRGAFRYSNLSYIVVGAAIDRLAAMSFEDALRRHLLDPLGVQSLGFAAPGRVATYNRFDVIVGR